MYDPSLVYSFGLMLSTKTTFADVSHYIVAYSSRVMLDGVMEIQSRHDNYDDGHDPFRTSSICILTCSMASQKKLSLYTYLQSVLSLRRFTAGHLSI